MTSRSSLAAACEVPCQDLRALQAEVRRDRIRSQRELAALAQKVVDRDSATDKKLDAILGEVQALRQFMVEWVKAGRKR